MLRDTKSKMKKMAKRGRGLGHVTYFSNFGTPLISVELLKIQTSNFACWWKVRDTKSKMKNWPKRWRGLCHVTYFSNFGTPNISETAQLKIQTSNFARGLKVRDQILKKKCKTSQKGAWPRLRATSKSGDILNIQATEALKNGKIRESIAFDFKHGYQM